MKVRDMSNEEARYAIFSAIEMGETINAGEYPYHSVLVCAEMALDKQIAKKLVVWDNGTQHCPNCEHDLTYISSEDEYCCRCGQKFLWEVE